MTHKSLLLADLQRAIDLLMLTDSNKLEFEPDPKVSDDIRKLTGLESYPVTSHLANLKARFDAVEKAGDDLVARGPSNYVSNLIVACAKLTPPSDD